MSVTRSFSFEVLGFEIIKRRKVFNKEKEKCSIKRKDVPALYIYIYNIIIENVGFVTIFKVLSMS